MPITLPSARPILTRLLAALVLAAASVSATDAAAQDFEDFDYGPEVSRYVLTEDMLAKVTQAARNLKPLREPEAEFALSGAADADNLDAIVGVMESDSATAQAIRAAGLEPREFVTFLLAFMQGSVFLIASASEEDAEPPATTALEKNVQFIVSHLEEVQELVDALQAVDGEP